MGSTTEHHESLDIVVIGAGLAGINCAYRLRTRHPTASIAVLEARANIGGTWDFFKYPGIRSDSDLYSYGFAWEPWPYEHPIAEAELIVSYLHHCVDKHGLRKYIHLDHRVTGADWHSPSKRWTLAADHNGQRKLFTAKFVVLGTGYYDYDAALPSVIPGIDSFQGKVIHPQFWPTDYDFSNKEIVVVGSGATAITLIPSLAAKATKHITMLQRSPSYIVAANNRGRFAHWWFLPRALRQWLNWAYSFTVPIALMFMARRYPVSATKSILADTAKLLPAGVPLDPHFTPRYNPWQQRLCMSPDGDFFACLHPGEDGAPARASVVTAEIKTVTADSIVCRDGQVLKPDVIVTATGLKMLFAGGIPLRVDGERIDAHECAIWEGCMLSDVPNLFFMGGYAWASWTVGVDNGAITLSRLLAGMHKRGQEVAVPRLPAGPVPEKDRGAFIKLSSTYVQADRSMPFVINSGTGPWKATGNVWADWLHARLGSIGKSLVFS